jgi:serine/threonine protein kinase
MTFCVGEVLGDYQIIGVIGCSENQLFQVEHRITKRRETMRVVLAELIFEGNIDRLTREVEVLARLNHPGIAGVHDVFSLIDRLLVISEFVEGQSLAALISKGLSLDSGVDYVCQALTALAYAHAEGVVHGNITPANIVITGQGVAKLVNFGFVQSLHELRGASLAAESGVLPYAPRKRACGYHVSDPLADVYSVGSVLCEIVIGRRSSDTEGVDTIPAQFQQEALPATDQELRRRVHDVILKARCQDPLLRYQSANELLSALNSVKTEADARCREGRGFGLVRNGSIGALLILSAAAGVVKFNTYQPPAQPAAVVFAIPAPNLSQLHRTSTPIAVPKKDRAVALARKVSQATTEVEVKQVPEQQQLANAIVETTPPQPERKNTRIWSKLKSINPFRKRTKASKPTTDEPAFPH